jgi:RimJ/RimL family protein N-acetyltransferase
MTDLPILEGKNLHLRQLIHDDRRSLAYHANDEEISRFITHIPYPYTQRHADAWIEKTKRLLDKDSEHHFGICDKETDDVIGIIGLKNINHTDLNAELEYWIGKDHRRQGKTTEAIWLILGYAFNTLGLHRVYAVVHEQNIGSVKVLEKVGLIREGIWREASRWEGVWCDVYAYGILEDEWNRK